MAARNDSRGVLVNSVLRCSTQIKNALSLNVSYLTRGPGTISPLQERMGFTKLLLVSAGIGCTRILVVREVVRTCTLPSRDMHLHAICRPTKSRKKLIDFHLVNCFLLRYVCVCGHATVTRGYKLLARCSTRYLVYVCYIYCSSLAFTAYLSSPHTEIFVGKRRR